MLEIKFQLPPSSKPSNGICSLNSTVRGKINSLEQKGKDALGSIIWRGEEILLTTN